MEPHRLRAPRADGGLLAEPPLDQAGPALAANAHRLAAWDHDFQGRRAERLRAMARQQVLGRSRAFHQRFGLDTPAPADPSAPLLVTGHQPELFHPGVWVKNFALNGLARAHGGIPINLIVDNDIPKDVAIRVPTPAEADVGLKTVPVDFDDWSGEIPYEDHPVADEARFARFGDRVRSTLAGLVPDPLIDDFWPLARRAADATDRAGLRFTLARHRIEAGSGVVNWEVPLSDVCETDAFRWFASHLLAQIARFRQIHNQALLRYRKLYGIRSKHHPVPSLRDRVGGDWQEAPFWAWRREQPRRRALLVRQADPRTMQLRIESEAEPFLTIPLGPDREACCAVEELRRLEPMGIRLRTRALTTTMFARLVLGDLFVHGIGGAKYDELGDEIIHGFFGVEPPRFLTLSMTLWLGLEPDPASADRLRAVERSLRDLTFNPDRHLGNEAGAEARDLVAAKRAAIAGPTATRRQRVARGREIARINQILQPAVADGRDRLEAERSALRAGLRRNAIVGSREYAAVLHSRRRLERAFAGVVASATAV